MLNFHLKKTIIFAFVLFFLCGCSPLIPNNYLGPSSITTPQKINGTWKEPRLIPINATTLNSPEGRTLLEPLMQPQPYRIGSFDSLNIIVWGHPEISTVPTAPAPSTNVNSNIANLINPASPAVNSPILVESDGTIFYPYVGHPKIAGLTIDQVQKILTERLSAYIRDPQISVQVAKYRNRNAYILGEVKMPGMQPLTDKPLTLMEAISGAGGINSETADPSHIYVVRGSYRQPDVYWLNATTPQSLMIAEKFPLQENDIVYVSAASLNSWNRFINQVLPSYTTYIIAKDLTK